MWFRFSLVALTALCLGCTTNSPANNNLNKTDCVTEQGVWLGSVYEDAAAGQCVVPTTDAGQQCHSNRECKSACVTSDEIKSGEAASGQCFGWSKLVGHCVNLVDDDGLAEGTVCYD